MTEIIGSIVLVLLCLTGMVTVLQAFCGWLLSPGEEDTMIVLVPVRGHCEEAELLLRSAVHRVQRMGGKDRKILLCVDCGMDTETRAICERFCDSETIELINPQRITSYFRCNTTENDV